MDILHHPDFGELAWIADQGRWFAEHRLPSGRPLDVFVEPGESDASAFLAIAGRLLLPAIAAGPRLLDEAIRRRALAFLADCGLETTAEDLAARLVWECLIIAAEDFPLVYVHREVEPDLFEGRELHVDADPDLQLRDVGYYRPGPPAG